MLRRLRLICFVIIKIKTNLSDQMSQKPEEEKKANQAKPVSIFDMPVREPEPLNDPYVSDPFKDGQKAAAAAGGFGDDPPSFGGFGIHDAAGGGFGIHDAGMPGTAGGGFGIHDDAGGGLGPQASSAGGGVGDVSFGAGGMLSYMSGGSPAIWSLKSSPLQSLATSASNIASSAGSGLQEGSQDSVDPDHLYNESPKFNEILEQWQGAPDPDTATGDDPQSEQFMVSFLRDFLAISWPQILKHDEDGPLSRNKIIFQSADTNVAQLILYLKNIFMIQHSTDKPPAWIDGPCAAALLQKAGYPLREVTQAQNHLLIVVNLIKQYATSSRLSISNFKRIHQAWLDTEDPPEPEFKRWPSVNWEDNRRQIIYQLTIYVLKSDQNQRGLEEKLQRWPVFEVLCGLLMLYDAKKITPKLLDSFIQFTTQKLPRTALTFREKNSTKQVQEWFFIQPQSYREAVNLLMEGKSPDVPAEDQLEDSLAAQISEQQQSLKTFQPNIGYWPSKIMELQEVAEEDEDGKLAQAAIEKDMLLRPNLQAGLPHVKVPIFLLGGKVKQRLHDEALQDWEKMHGFAWVPYHSVHSVYRAKSRVDLSNKLVFVLNFFKDKLQPWMEPDDGELVVFSWDQVTEDPVSHVLVSQFLQAFTDAFLTLPHQVLCVGGKPEEQRPQEFSIIQSSRNQIQVAEALQEFNSVDGNADVNLAEEIGQKKFCRFVDDAQQTGKWIDIGLVGFPKKLGVSAQKSTCLTQYVLSHKRRKLADEFWMTNTRLAAAQSPLGQVDLEENATFIHPEKWYEPPTGDHLSKFNEIFVAFASLWKGLASNDAADDKYYQKVLTDYEPFEKLVDECIHTSIYSSNSSASHKASFYEFGRRSLNLKLNQNRDLDASLIIALNNLLGFAYFPTLGCLLSGGGRLESRNLIGQIRDFVNFRGIHLKDTFRFIPMHLRGQLVLLALKRGYEFSMDQLAVSKWSLAVFNYLLCLASRSTLLLLRLDRCKAGLRGEQCSYMVAARFSIFHGCWQIRDGQEPWTNVLPVRDQNEWSDKRVNISLLLSDCYRLTLYELSSGGPTWAKPKAGLLRTRYNMLKDMFRKKKDPPLVLFQQILQKLKKKEQSFKRSEIGSRQRITIQYDFSESCDVRNPPASCLEEYKDDLAQRISEVVKREGKTLRQARKISSRSQDGEKLSHALERRRFFMTRFTQQDHAIDFPFLEVFMPSVLQPKELEDSPMQLLGYVKYDLRTDIDLVQWFSRFQKQVVSDLRLDQGRRNADVQAKLAQIAEAQEERKRRAHEEQKDALLNERVSNYIQSQEDNLEPVPRDKCPNYARGEQNQCHLIAKNLCTGRHYRDEASDLFQGFLSNQKAQKQFQSLRQSQGASNLNPIDLDGPLIKGNQSPPQSRSDSGQNQHSALNLEHLKITAQMDKHMTMQQKQVNVLINLQMEQIYQNTEFLRTLPHETQAELQEKFRAFRQSQEQVEEDSLQPSHQSPSPSSIELSTTVLQGLFDQQQPFSQLHQRRQQKLQQQKQRQQKMQQQKQQKLQQQRQQQLPSPGDTSKQMQIDTGMLDSTKIQTQLPANDSTPQNDEDMSDSSADQIMQQTPAQSRSSEGLTKLQELAQRNRQETQSNSSQWELQMKRFLLMSQKKAQAQKLQDAKESETLTDKQELRSFLEQQAAEADENTDIQFNLQGKLLSPAEAKQAEFQQLAAAGSGAGAGAGAGVEDDLKMSGQSESGATLIMESATQNQAAASGQNSSIEMPSVQGQFSDVQPMMTEQEAPEGFLVAELEGSTIANSAPVVAGTPLQSKDDSKPIQSAAGNPDPPKKE